MFVLTGNPQTPTPSAVETFQSPMGHQVKKQLFPIKATSQVLQKLTATPTHLGKYLLFVIAIVVIFCAIFSVHRRRGEQAIVAINQFFDDRTCSTSASTARSPTEKER